MISKLLILFFVVLSALSEESAADSCLRYETVSLSGTLVRQVYPGPPDYESVTKGDEPRVIWVLLLEKGICAVDPEQRYPREYYEREIQLVVGSDQYTPIRALLGKKIVASGELQHGGARYDKRLVLKTDEIRRARRGR